MDDLLNDQSQVPSLEDVVKARISQPKLDVDPALAETFQRQNRVDEATRSVSVGIQKNPDEMARYIRLAAKTGMDPELLIEDPDLRRDMEIKQTREGINLDRLIQTNPKTVAFLSNPQNAAVSYDDVDNLSFLEMAFGAIAKGGRSFAAGAAPSFASSSYGALAAPFGIARKYISEPTMAFLDANDISPGGNLRYIDPFGFVEQKLLSLKKDTEAADKLIEGLTGQEGLVESGARAGMKSFGQFATAALTRDPKMVLGLLSGQTAGAGYAQGREAGLDPLMSVYFGAVQGTAEYVTEKTPIGMVFSNNTFKKSLLKAFVNLQVVEGGTEQLATAWQDLNEWAIINKDKTFADYLKERPNAALQTAIATAVGTTGQTAVGKGLSMMGQSQAQDSRAFFDALAKGVTDSKLHKRLPEKTREFITELKQDSDIQSVFIDATKFQSYFQSKGVDPNNAANEILGENGAAKLSEALATGGDMVIPLENYAEKVAGSEYHPELVGDLRLRQGDLSENEAQLELKNMDTDEKELEKLVKQVQEGKLLDESASLVFDDIFAQATAIGVPQSQAETWALLESERYRTRAARLGVTAEQLWQEEGGLEIVRDGMPGVPEGATTLNQGEIDPKAEAADAAYQQFKNMIYSPSSEFQKDVKLNQFYNTLKDNINQRVERTKKLTELAGEYGIYLWDKGDLVMSPKTGKVYQIIGRTWSEPVGKNPTQRQIDNSGPRYWYEVYGKKEGDEGYERGQFITNPAHKSMIKVGGQFNQSGFENNASGESAASIEAQNRLKQELAEGRVRYIYDRGQVRPLIGVDAVDTNARAGQVILQRGVGNQEWTVLSKGDDMTEGDVNRARSMMPKFQSSSVVNTQEFKAWFGDSKVVDTEGKPLVVYHGTKSDFDSFDINKLGASTGAGRGSMLGFWFSASPDAANIFTGVKGTDGGNVMPVYLNIQNPYLMKNSELVRLMIQTSALDSESQGAVIAEFRERLVNQGYDGVEILTQVESETIPVPEESRSVIGSDEITIPPAEGKDNEGNGRRFVAFRPDQIKSAIGNQGTFDPNSPNILEQKDRGMVQFGDQFRRITLFADSDPTTFIHELGHTWLEELKKDASREGAPAQLKADYDTARKWMGLKEGDAISVEAHEKWARGIEAYFMEGKSPNTAIQKLFYKAKAWMIGIYKTITKLDVKLNNEIREVFDRMISLDEEIERAKAMHNQVKMFATPEDAGMTQDEFNAYSKAVDDSVQAEKEQMAKEVADDLRKEQNAERRRVAKEARAAIYEARSQEPVYAAIIAMTTGGGKKISKQAIIDLMGEDFLKQLNPSKIRTSGWIYSTEGGIHPEIYAREFGFPDAKTMLTSIATAQPLNDVVDADTTAEVVRQLGNALDPAQLSEKADEIVNGDRQEEVLQIELRALKRKMAEVERLSAQASATERKARAVSRRSLGATIPTAVLKDVAFQQIAATRIADLNPTSFQYAMVRASKKAIDLAGKGEYAAAVDAKVQQMLNLYLFQEATKARRASQSMIRKAYNMTKDSARKRIGKAGQEWLEQLDSLLDQYSFATMAQTGKARSLADWAKSVEETTGEVIAVSPKVLQEAERTNFRELTVDELRGVYDTLLSIEHVAKKISGIVRNGVEFEFGETVDQLVETIHANIQSNPMPETVKELTKAGEIARLTSGFFNSNLRPEKIIEWLDGGKQGIWHDLLWNQAVDAQNMKDDLRKLVMGPLAVANANMTAEQKEAMNEKHMIPSLGQSITKRTIIGIALNAGNKSNLDKLQKGGMWFGEQHTQISDTALSEILDTMTQEEWMLVQSMWDAINKLYPYLNDLNMRAVGLPLVKVEASPVETKFGTFAGGYWPAVADPRHSKLGEIQENSETFATDMFPPRYPKAATSHSFREERTGAVYPLQFDWERVLSTHVNKAITDISYHEWIKQTRRLIEAQPVKKALQNSIGEENYRSMEEWLMHQVAPVHGGYSANSSVAGLQNMLLSNTMVAALGFRAVTAIANMITAPVQASHQVKPTYMVQGVAKFFQNPFKAIRAVHALSGEMRHRFDHYEQSFNIIMNQLEGKNTFRAEMARWAMAIHLYADKVTSTAIWTAKYQQEIDAGQSPDAAMRLADKVIRTTQTAGAPKDLSSFERDPRYSIFKMFIGPMIILQNEMRGSVRGKGVKALWDKEVWATMIATWILPSMLFEYAAGRGPEDDEEFMDWALRKILLYPAQTVPFVRDAADAAEQALAGREAITRSNPITDMLLSLTRSATKAFNEDAELEDQVIAFSRTAGVLFGLPTNQAIITADFLKDLWTGEYEMQGIEDLKYLIYRREE